MEIDTQAAVEVQADGDATAGEEESAAMLVDGGRVSKRSLDRVKGPWSPDEDAKLSQLVSNFGARNWSLIARGIPGRSGKSCRLRWCNQLDPAVKRKPFTGNLAFFIVLVMELFSFLICWISACFLIIVNILIFEESSSLEKIR
ncbi:hypothetical protein CDL12_02375 [Handroanthus impetiginosus]|uniref:Uncharacterized protein n=1 Tax=Handroanthus impetiginosus TaxID=429701 RepID=A0A2G9I531_9LAMI|nr:hypothetical protein CDL12_02375 [Handroanthus impetiginosus]